MNLSEELEELEEFGTNFGGIRSLGGLMMSSQKDPEKKLENK